MRRSEVRVINYEKSDLTPSQDFQFIGMQFNTRQFTVAPLPKMRLKVQTVHQHWMTNLNITARDLHRLLSMLVFMASLVQRGRLRLRPVQWWAATAWCQRTGSWSDRITVPQWVLSEVAWWASPAVLQGLPSPPRKRKWLSSRMRPVRAGEPSEAHAGLGDSGQHLKDRGTSTLWRCRQSSTLWATSCFIWGTGWFAWCVTTHWLWLTSRTREAQDRTH